MRGEGKGADFFVKIDKISKRFKILDFLFNPQTLCEVKKHIY